MRFERVAVSDKPTWLCAIARLHGGQLLQNTGRTELLVGMGEYAESELAADSGVLIAPGVVITWPTPDASSSVPVHLYARSLDGAGEISYAVLQG